MVTPDDTDDDPVSLLELGTDRPNLGEETSDDLQGTEDLNEVSSEARKIISRDRIRKAVREAGYEQGVTHREVADLTGLSKKTVEKHLDALSKMREVYRRKRSGTWFYYPNGKPLHSFGTERVESGEVILDIQLAEGPRGDHFVHVTEKRFTLKDGESAEGAVMFPLDAVDELVAALRQCQEEVDHQ